MLNGRTCGSIDAAGIQLTERDTDCAGLILQRPRVVLEGVRQCAALRSDQHQYQQEI